MDADNTLGGLGVCGRGEGGVASFRLLLEDSKLHHDCVVILVTDGFVLIDGRVGLSVGDVVCVGSRSTLAAAFLTLLDLGMNLHTRARFEKNSLVKIFRRKFKFNSEVLLEPTCAQVKIH